MNPQRSAPRPYPDPSTADQHMAGAPYYQRPAQPRPLQPALSQDDQTLANSLAHEMNGHALPEPAPLSQRDSVSVQHTGAEPNPDLSFEGKPAKGRTKVSRACDECRKTKVRCDAATSTSAGSVLDRCSNCARKNVSCQFNRPPQKRGPSKGYIKELADRVLQVESHVGLPGARPSFDDSSPPDGYEYSPTHSLSGNRKRTHSQIEGLFSQSPQRHSLGGFTLGQSSSRPRDSIALAPDEKFDDLVDERVEMRQPFWVSWKADVSVAPHEMVGEWDNPDLFESYLALVDPHLSILPSYEVFKRYVCACTPKQVAALEYVMSQATGRKVGGFSNERELEDFVIESAKQHPKSRTPASNIGWLWVFVFMILNSDADMERLVGVGRPILKSSLIELACATAAEVDDPEVARIRLCLGVLARLHALGTGTRDELEGFERPDLRLSDETALLAGLSNIWSVLAETAATPTFRIPKLAMFTKYDVVAKDSLNAIVSRYDSPLAAQVKAFVSLMLTRQNRGNDPEAIRSEMEKLIDVLTVDSSGPLAKPMEAHLYIVAVITCLELIENDGAFLGEGRQALDRLRPGLKSIHHRATARMQSSATGGWPDSARQWYWVEVLTDKMDRALAEFAARPDSRRAVSSQVFAGVSGGPATLATNSVVSRGTKYVCYNFAQMSHQGHLVALGVGYVPKRLKLSR